MTQYAGWIWWLIVSIGILVTFHEFGHFWVARRFGVKVLRFSVGFGRPILRRVGRDGTEYVVGWIPLGGYVRMLDEREGEVPAALQEQAFNRKSVFQRFAIVAAGPIFNLILCVALLWAMYTLGKPDLLPLVGKSQGIAAEAGLRPDDRILSIDGERIETWTHAQIALALAAADARPVKVEVLRDTGDSASLQLDLGRLTQAPEPARTLVDIGLIPQQALIEPVVASVAPDTAAAEAGLQAGDRLLSIDGHRLRSWDEIGTQVQRGAGQSLNVVYERAGQRHEVTLTPTLNETVSPPRWVLGINAASTQIRYDALLRYGPLQAVGAAFRETWRMTTSTLGFLWRMIKGAVSVKNISGPISIAEYADTSAQMGLAWFLSFLAMLSLSLCIMNLLPIPVLDGGHLMYYLIEMIKGSPVGERTMATGQMIGMVVLAGLMSLAFYNDILRLLTR